MERFESIYYASITSRLKNGGIMIYNWQDYNKAKNAIRYRDYIPRKMRRWRAKKERRKKRLYEGGKARKRNGLNLGRPFIASASGILCRGSFFFFFFFHRVTHSVKMRHTRVTSRCNTKRLWMLGLFARTNEKFKLRVLRILEIFVTYEWGYVNFYFNLYLLYYYPSKS